MFGVLWGYIADRFGTRWFGLIAAFAMSGSLFALSQQESILQFYGLYFLFGAFGNAMVTSPLFANVGFWFTHKPGLALGITASGGAVGQAVVPYLCALSLELYGWQTTYMLSAGFYLAPSTAGGTVDSRITGVVNRRGCSWWTKNERFLCRNAKSLSGSALRLFSAAPACRYPLCISYRC